MTRIVRIFWACLFVAACSGGAAIAVVLCAERHLMPGVPLGAFSIYAFVYWFRPLVLGRPIDYENTFGGEVPSIGSSSRDIALVDGGMDPAAVAGLAALDGRVPTYYDMPEDVHGNREV